MRCCLKFPVKLDKPAFAMTVVYKKAKWLKKPLMEVYLDGPFYGHGDSAKEKAESLHAQVYAAMTARSRSSNCAYIEYRPKTDR